ncbi:mRNA capping enzyme, catalytic domain-containing protein [Phakopsora pachyrhizi]|nr:mRNA capping enzyme, catalytic domain-containing protein [Phakopsora pachyrhizi]
MDHTLLDCDLIEEADPNDPEKKHFELLVFDCLAIGGVPKNNLPMKSRYDILKRAIIPPYDKLLIEKPHWKDKMPLRLKLKKMSPLSEIRKVYLEEMPNLNHKTNGLILTGVNSKFGQGKYTEVYKWKPSIDISINLKLKLNYPANLHDDSLEDEFKKKATLETNHAEKNIKPKFSLYSRYRGEDIFFSELDISDNDWKTLKCSDIELEESIVEVKWDFQKFDWKFSRFREDRHQANNKLTVDEIIECLKFKLEFDDLCRILESNEKIKNVNNQSSN